MAVKNNRERIIDALLTMEIGMALDTAKLLAVVEREKTENESLRALVGANTAAFKDVSSQLATANANITDLQTKLSAAIASGDPAAVAALQAQVTDLQGQVNAAQADVDKATADLSTDADATQAALAANTAPAPAPADAPAAAPADGAAASGDAGTVG